MRGLITLLIVNLSLCDVKPAAPENEAPPSVPTLREQLAVTPSPAKRGEPIALVGGRAMMCALRKDAPAACLGEIGLALAAVGNDDGRYVRGHTERPLALEGLDLRHLDADDDDARCFYSPGDGPVNCWFRDAARQELRLPVLMTFDSALDVASSAQICAISRSHEVECSGAQTCFKTDGVDEIWDPKRPVEVPGLGKARLIARSLHLGCVVHLDSTVTCWGKIEKGECVREARVVPGLTDIVDVSVSSYSACALRADNRVFCWGDNGRAELGDPGASFATTPIEVPLAHPAVKLRSAGRGFVALRADGSVVGWGHSVFGDRNTPPAKLKFKRPAVDFVAMRGLVCALLDTGSVECDGYKVRFAEAEGRPRPPFEGKEPWVNAPLYRLAAEPSG